MDRLTRHELKTDKFVEEVGQTLTFFEEHRKEFIRYGGIGLAVALIAAAGYFYVTTRRDERQAALFKAVETYNAPVLPDGREGMLSFPTQTQKTTAVDKEMNAIITKYPGTEQAGVANYLLGLQDADAGMMDEAEKYLKVAVELCGKDYGSLAKYSLAQIYSGLGRQAEAEKLLRDLVAHPTIMVGADTASLQLGRVVAKTNPEEARKILEPLRTATGPVGRYAIQELSDLHLNK